MKIKVVSVRRGYGSCKVLVDYEISDDAGTVLDKASCCFSQDKWSDENCERTLLGILERAAAPNPLDIGSIRSSWVGKEIVA